MASPEMKPSETPPSYLPSSDERMWGLLAHLSPLIASGMGLPFLGPLIIWLIKKDESPFIADQAKEALNFQIAVLLAVMICAATVIGILLLPIVAVGALIYSIMAAMEANKGVYYRYPYTLRFIK
ncbi:conserved hypothetical protein [Pirellula staleyi DSM 6068]|uniref:Orotate phosphoribosyltransferase n=1 Tax=Pirellula staleyi (strain ATCC 27377 / DSM 6068 / ICPB 4128) TaxID=530564 RepID=D2R5X2_PIRSD|nr:DUF4870 domain-containing protein [Pirellula staleyi]ADB19057.1 conserved hypothetical protein [Pirellula staleyi DSM 6068]